MNISSSVTSPVTSLAVAPAILAAANLLLPHFERGQRVDAAVLRNAIETAFGTSDATGTWNWKLAWPSRSGRGVGPEARGSVFQHFLRCSR